MASVSPAIAYTSAIPAVSDAEVPTQKNGALGSGTGHVSLVIRRRAIWIGVAIVVSLLAPCHAPNAGQAGATGTWQIALLCPTWLVPGR
ncbi:MAG: hypothetical protein EXR45_07840 [Chloroflexi bacterium]|nr:hypothetical protein [Chloroflexota bacterium]